MSLQKKRTEESYETLVFTEVLNYLLTATININGATQCNITGDNCHKAKKTIKIRVFTIYNRGDTTHRRRAATHDIGVKWTRFKEIVYNADTKLCGIATNRLSKKRTRYYIFTNTTL